MIWGETPEILLKPQLEISDGPLERIACFERGLFAAAHKDIFFRKEIKWFGKILSGQTVSHPEGTQGLSELRRPETAGKIVQFLQAINWMPTSLPELAELEAPLRALLEDCPQRTAYQARGGASCYWQQRVDIKAGILYDDVP